MEYCGWSMFDEVTIVAKNMLRWDNEEHINKETEGYQGYIVDAKNKKQLATAMNWARQIIYGHYDEATRSYPEKKVVEGIPFTYKNDGFTLELGTPAGSSSQGGKLSFWNCWITAPDGKKFLVGIASDLLLDVLKSTTVINGVVQDKLMFARCKAGVGMLSPTMEAYKQAQADMEHKAKVAKGKTSKHKIGHVYETIREKNIYLGKLYQHYEPVYVEENRGWTTRQKLVGFKRREKPVEYNVFPDYAEGKNKLTDYTNSSKSYIWWNLTPKKLPARVESDIIVELDTTLDDVVKWINNHELFANMKAVMDAQTKKLLCNPYTDTDKIGLTTNPDKFEFSEKELEALKILNLRVFD